MCRVTTGGKIETNRSGIVHTSVNDELVCSAYEYTEEGAGVRVDSLCLYFSKTVFPTPAINYESQ